MNEFSSEGKRTLTGSPCTGVRRCLGDSFLNEDVFFEGMRSLTLFIYTGSLCSKVSQVMQYISLFSRTRDEAENPPRGIHEVSRKKPPEQKKPPRGPTCDYAC